MAAEVVPCIPTLLVPEPSTFILPRFNAFTPSIPVTLPLEFKWIVPRFVTFPAALIPIILDLLEVLEIDAWLSTAAVLLILFKLIVTLCNLSFPIAAVAFIPDCEVPLTLIIMFVTLPLEFP